MAGLVGQYNQVPRLFNQVAVTDVPPESVALPTYLKNIRGQTLISIVQSDSTPGVFSSFGVTGGFGEWPDDYTRNWYFVAGSFYNCAITNLPLPTNTIDIVTTAPNTPIRKYRFVFSPNQSVPPVVQMIEGDPVLVTFRQSKQSLIEGF